MHDMLTYDITDETQTLAVEVYKGFHENNPTDRIPYP